MSSAPTRETPAADVLAARLAWTADAIEALLDQLLGETAREGEIARPERLLAAMRHGALGGGKRLRPFLTVETARLFGVAPEAALRAGAAVELVHCYSLVHDDLPAMDDDDTRRGRPTVHKAYDEASAILAGDTLLTYAFEVLAGPATHPSGEIRAALVLALPALWWWPAQMPSLRAWAMVLALAVLCGGSLMLAVDNDPARADVGDWLGGALLCAVLAARRNAARAVSAPTPSASSSDCSA